MLLISGVQSFLSSCVAELVLLKLGVIFWVKARSWGFAQKGLNPVYCSCCYRLGFWHFKSNLLFCSKPKQRWFLLWATKQTALSINCWFRSTNPIISSGHKIIFLQFTYKIVNHVSQYHSILVVVSPLAYHTACHSSGQTATSFQYEVVPILIMNTAAFKTKCVWSQLNQILSNPPKFPFYSIHKSRFIVNVYAV